MTRRSARIAASVALSFALPGAVAAQEVRSVVSPDTIAVGDIARVGIRVDVPPGQRLVAPDSLPVAGDLENAGPRQLTSAALPDGGERVTIVYPVTAWRPGPQELPAIEIALEGDGTTRGVAVPLPGFAVRSVLPADTAGVEPRVEKDVLGPNWALWPFLVGLFGLVAAGGAFAYWWRRRPVPAEAIIAASVRTPRQRALAELERTRAAGWLEAGEWKAFYSGISEPIRRYLEAVAPGWSTDLTTAELVSAMRAAGRPGLDRLEAILDAADLVKFARGLPDREEALDVWSAAREWVAAFVEPGRVEEVGKPGDAAPRVAAPDAPADDDERPERIA